MSLILMYITNSEDIALIAEESGVDWIFVDLEILGKEERQGHLNTVISKHSIVDIIKIRRIIRKSKLLVRINPINKESKCEIDRVIGCGADIIMLPYFKTNKEVEIFLSLVDKRLKTCLLLETPEAVKEIDEILNNKGIDYIHIGLNDLHIGYGMRFMFELLINGIVETLCQKIGKQGIKYGFGGIARIGHGVLRSEYVITEHYRLGSSMAILSRSFCNAKDSLDIKKTHKMFLNGVNEIRLYEDSISNKANQYFIDNLNLINKLVMEIISGDKG